MQRRNGDATNKKVTQCDSDTCVIAFCIQEFGVDAVVQPMSSLPADGDQPEGCQVFFAEVLFLWFDFVLFLSFIRRGGKWKTLGHKTGDLFAFTFS